MANEPPYFKGVCELRGVIQPIIDLRLELTCERAKFNQLTVVIMPNVGDRLIGTLVDSVSDVLRLGAEPIKPAPGMNFTAETQHIIGIGCICIWSWGLERRFILLIIERTMSSTRLRLPDKPWY